MTDPTESHRGTQPPAARRSPRRVLHKARRALLPGFLSGGLYTLLYYVHEDIRHLAERTASGDKLYFLVPIVIAFAFSFAHGWFTDRFWDVLGLRAKH